MFSKRKKDMELQLQENKMIFKKNKKNFNTDKQIKKILKSVPNFKHQLNKFTMV